MYDVSNKSCKCGLYHAFCSLSGVIFNLAMSPQYSYDTTRSLVVSCTRQMTQLCPSNQITLWSHDSWFMVHHSSFIIQHTVLDFAPVFYRNHLYFFLSVVVVTILDSSSAVFLDPTHTQHPAEPRVLSHQPDLVVQVQILHQLDCSLEYLLPRRFQRTPWLFDGPHRDVFVTLLEAEESFICKSIQRHSEFMSIFNVRLVLLVV